MKKDNGHLTIEIEDAAREIPMDKRIALESSVQTGVGLRGMRERMRRLGGTLEIHSDGKGTRVTASLPTATHSSAEQPST